MAGLRLNEYILAPHIDVFLLQRNIVDFFTQHSEEIEPFLNESFAEYAVAGDAAALLAALRVIARVKGISSMAEDIPLTRQGLQKALSAKVAADSLICCQATDG